ncbi:response regulator transcription factor [Ktedonospora formicarum]|uniref:DNA-binding response regulator n=1 Tax=Ktedonospora formicarum TaxID=2778364 RepID=A0A8J3I550_9CHLR|nr:response regulator transcription factor [Ktedonospora formicarum]GHO47243.1 DNA-binding response regulator [Ktedonospora formicarum]
MQQKILVVDDDKKTVDLIRLYLEKERYRVSAAFDGQTALDLARQKPPDLMILDWMLPGIDGLQVCRLVRAESDIPIILLTARSTEDEKLLGLHLGADDYLTKPFSPRELVARVRVVLRRARQKQAEENQPPLYLGDLVVDFVAHEAFLHHVLVHLTPKEFKLLETLAREPGRAFSRAELVTRVFGLDYEGFERTIDVHMMNLRKKIEPSPDQPIYLQTVYGVGYKLRKERENENS